MQWANDPYSLLTDPTKRETRAYGYPLFPCSETTDASNCRVVSP